MRTKSNNFKQFKKFEKSKAKKTKRKKTKHEDIIITDLLIPRGDCKFGFMKTKNTIVRIM